MLIRFSTILLVVSFFISSSFYLQGQAWEQLKDTPFSTDHTNGYGLGDKAFLIQGFADNSRNKVWEYVPASDTWTLLMNFPGPPRALAIGDELDGKFYYGFGFGEIGGLNDLWVFDPTDMSFTELPSCPCEGRGHPALIAYEGKIYMGSGSTDNNDLNDWWIYDIAAQTWTEKENIPGSPRHHPFFFESGDKVYVGGGHVRNWLSYDINNEEWAEIDGFPEGRVAGAQLSYKGYGLLIGGDDRVHDHVPFEDTFLSYDPSEDEWSRLPPLPNGSRWAPSSFIVNDELYFLDGVDYDTESDSTFWKIDLSVVGCSPAQNLSSMNITTNSADLFWSGNSDADSDTLKYRIVGDTEWNSIPNPQAVLSLNGLETCQEYEFVVTNACGSNNSNSETHTFKTDGCCINPPLSVAESRADQITFEWEGILAASDYEIRSRIEGGPWTQEIVTDPNYTTTGLSPCTKVEFQIRSICSIEAIDFGDIFVAYSGGCGPCIDIDYCPIPEDFNSEVSFIEEVNIDGNANVSGNDMGYGNFTSPETQQIVIGQEFSISIKPGDLPASGNAILAVWIDYNLDGEFSNREKVIRETIFDELITRDISIPQTALMGLSRMRVMTGTDFPAVPCAAQNDDFGGEVEDYCVELVNTVSVDDLNDTDFDVVPNPFDNNFLITGKLKSKKPFSVILQDMTGRTVKVIEDVQSGDNLSVSELGSGAYFVTIKNNEVSQTIKVVKY